MAHHYFKETYKRTANHELFLNDWVNASRLAPLLILRTLETNPAVAQPYMSTDTKDLRLGALKAVLDACQYLKFTPGSTNDPKLVDGLYYDHSKLQKGTWVLSVYRNAMTAGNDFETAIYPHRLAWCQHRTTFPQFRRSKFPHSVAVPVLSRM